jgi:outer membrane protein
VKTLIKSIAMTAAASSLLLSAATYAKEQKIGVVNVQLVVSQLPQMAVIQESLKNEFKDQVAVFEKLQADLKYNLEKQKRDSAIMSKGDLAALNETIEAQKVDYQTQGQALQQAMGRRENEERNKILALVKQAIDNVADKDKYDLILQQSAVAFNKADADISSQVVEQVSKLK